MGRRKKTNPTKAVTYRLDAELMANYELLLQDPVAERGAYGKKSYIVEQLLRRLLNAVRTESPTISVNDLVTELLGE